MVKNLKKLRTKNGTSQAQLASVLGLSQQSINKYENHNIEPDIATLVRMADHFGTTVDHLVGRSDEPAAGESITAEEQRIICGYRELSASEQLCIRTLIETYIGLKKKHPEEI